MSVTTGQVTTAAVALASVLALILVLSWVRRRLPVINAMTMQDRRTLGLLEIRATLAVDARRRLHLVEVQGAQALLLTGGGGDILIPWPSVSALAQSSGRP